MWSLVAKGNIALHHPAVSRSAMDAARHSLSVLPSMNNALLSTTAEQQSQQQHRSMHQIVRTRLPMGSSLSYTAPATAGIIVPTATNNALIGYHQYNQSRHLSSQPPGGGGPGGMNLGNIFNHAQNNQNKKPGETLEQYGVDLTRLAKEGKLDPVIGRHEEIRRTLQILGE